MSDRKSYGSPTAFRRALTDKLRTKAATSQWTLPELQRQMAYDRLLERLYLSDDGWILKGAAALLARDIGVRATIDVDVYRESSREAAEPELREAAAADIGDWFSFEIGAARRLGDGAGGVRLPATAYIGTSAWTSFRIDIVGAALRMTGKPEHVPPLARVVMPDVDQHGYRAYPLVDHVADKVAAMFEVYGPTSAPSTRYKDLVDLVAIVDAASIQAAPQLAALQSEGERRGVELPARFDVPDRELWVRGYPAEANRSLLQIALTLDAALVVVRPFLDPLLEGTVQGMWDPAGGLWKP